MRGRLLFVSMYPLAAGDSGPTVRARRLLAAFEKVTTVDLIDGYRGRRRRAWLAYLATGRLRHVDAVYVESSTALPSEMDLAGLLLAKLGGRPVVTYVRDAYQLFPDDYPTRTARQRLSRRAFPLAIQLLRWCSSRLAFPSAGLARAVDPRDADPLLLPPGAPEPVHVPLGPEAHSLLFVGDLRVPTQGGTALIEALEIARRRGIGADARFVTPIGGDPRPPHPPWLRIVRASSDEIAALLPDVIATVIPRAAGEYNDLAIPIKLMEYLAYARPIIATETRETAAIVRNAGCGVVVPDTPEGLADGIGEVMTASPEQWQRWAQAAADAARANSWSALAARILEILGIGSDRSPKVIAP